MKVIITLISFVFLFSSCGKTDTPFPTRNFGSNILHQSFVEIGNNNFLLLKENETKQLSTDFNNSFTLGNKLPFTQKFTKIQKSGEIYFLQTKIGLELVKKKDKVDEYETLSTIKSVSDCDIFSVNENTLVVAKGSFECGAGANPTIEVYDISDAAKPSLLAYQSTNNATALVIYKNKILLGEGDKGMRIFEFDGKTSIKEISKIEGSTVNQITFQPSDNSLITKNNKEIKIYKATNLSAPKLLTTINIGK